MYRKLLCILLIICIQATSSAALVFAEELTSRTAFQKEAYMPFSFYVGKVQRSFKETGNHALKTIDFSNYIKMNGDKVTKVTSLNGETTIDSENKIFTINTEKAQGVTGFIEDETIDLTDVIIESGNEYASIVVVSMDDKPINRSNRILIQSMTEEKVHGFTTENITHDGKQRKKVTRMGGGLMQVLKIKATVTLKGITKGYAAALDENGYVRDILTPVEKGGNLEIAIPEDAMYVVYSKSEITKPPEKEPEEELPTYVWWEGEAMTNNFTNNNWLTLIDQGAQTQHLSGNMWLAEQDAKGTGRYATYNVDVPQNGEYDLYVRKCWSYGAFTWSFDEQNFQTHNSGGTMLEEGPAIQNGHPVCWSYVGNVQLEKGTRTFRLDMISDKGPFAIDCFMLTLNTFVPDGKNKPDDTPLEPEEGYFAFKPGTDSFTSEAALNLRCLNEGYAGQDGFVTLGKAADGSGYFKLGNGMPVRFWGANAGPGIVGNNNTSLDYLAKSLAKRGVNLIRMHGSVYDIVDKKAEFDPVYLDRIHYFIKAMKEQGIYVSISIYFPLWFEFGETSGFAGYPSESGNKNPFAILQFNEDFQKLYKEGLKYLFESENPYINNVPLKDEPAIHSFEIQNEDNYFFGTFSKYDIPDIYREELETLFTEWLTTVKYPSVSVSDIKSSKWGNYNPEASGVADTDDRLALVAAWQIGSSDEWTYSQRIYDQIEFLTWHQKGFYQEIYDYMKYDIKSGSLIIPGNWTTADPTALEAIDRYTYDIGDIIDRHGYFEPAYHSSTGNTSSYSVRVGDIYEDRSALGMLDSAPLKFVQHEGKAYMQSEIDWSNPNRYRAEFPILYSAYASLQGIDAPVLFALSPSFLTSVIKFPLSTPAGLGQFPAAALIYRNSYVAETAPVVLEELNIKELYKKNSSFINEGQNLDELRAN